MPCYDPDTHERPERLAKKVNVLTDMLCRTCQQVGAYDLPDDVAVWWDNHKVFDEKRRLAREKYEQLQASGHPMPFWELTQEEQSIIWHDDD
jgi:hypothetical protein